MALLLQPGSREGDRNFEPNSAGRLHVYENRTTTYAAIYSDPDLTTALANPIDLDGGGLIPVNIYGVDGALYTYRVEYEDTAEVWTRNDCFGWSILSSLTYATVALAKEGSFADGDSVFVKDLGRYHYSATSTATADDVMVIAPSSGIGRLLIDASERPGLGLVGDGVADDTAGLQAALDAGGTIELPDGTYNFTNLDLTVAGTVLKGSRNAILNCTVDTNQFAIHLQASNIRLEGFTLQGPLANSTFITNHTGIYANETVYSPSVTINYLSGLEVIDVAIKNFGHYGIRFDYVQDCRIERNDIDYIGSHGIMLGAGCFDNIIDGNNVQNIVPGQTNQGVEPYHPAYGITITRDSSRDTTEAPISKRNRISNNRVTNVPSWIGIDSHGAQELTITDNLVQLCSICIHMEDGNGGGSIVPSTRVLIADNKCIGNTGTSFEEGPGISLQGSGDASTLQESITVSGNQITNCGYDITGLYSTRHGAIHALLVQGLSITGNAIISPAGIGIYLDGIQGGTIQGNTIENVQTSNSDTYGILLADGDVTVDIEGNAFFGASPQVNIASVSGTGGPDATYSIEVGRNIHHGTATKFENMSALHVWDGEYTSTERDAITSVPSGMRIFNTTTSKLQAYNGSAWVDLH